MQVSHGQAIDELKAQQLKDVEQMQQEKEELDADLKRALGDLEAKHKQTLESLESLKNAKLDLEQKLKL